MFNLGPMELVVILVLALFIFGPGKLPEVGKALGKSLNEFRRASREIGSSPDEPASRPVDPQAAAEEPAAEAHSPATAAPEGDPPPKPGTERPV